MLTVQLAFQLILFIGLGIFVQRHGIVDGSFDKSLTNLLLDVAVPCLIVKSFLLPFSLEDLRSCLLLLGLALLVALLSFLVGQAAYLAAGRGSSARMLRYAAIFSNFSFVGMPVVEALYGQKGLFYFVVFLIPMRVLYYTAPAPLLTPPGAGRARPPLSARLRAVCSPPMAAVLVGVALYVTRVPLPAVAVSVLSSMGAVCIPLGMMLCGISLAKHDMRAFLRPRFLRAPLLRNLLMPALVLGLAALLPLDALIAQLLVVYAALPVPSLLVAFTIEYDPAPGSRMESAATVFFSTLLCAATVPLWAAAAQAVFPL